MKYNAMFDVAFTVETEFPNHDDIPIDVLIKGLENRLINLKENKSEAAEAFGFCDQYEIEEGEKIELPELVKLWAQLGDIPVNEEDEIDEPFLHFEVGTPKEDVWHWFEDQNSKFIIGELFK